MFGKNPRATGSRIRRARVDCFDAELDLIKRTISISWQRPGKASLVLSAGNWLPLPEPMGDLRGTICADSLERQTRALFEFRFGRGNRMWSYDHGPWIAAALAEPVRARARAELLILTGALQWPAENGDLEDVAGDELAANFYASP